MAKGRVEIKVKLDIEPVVKLCCEKYNCINNLMATKGFYNCNLKHVTINQNGECKHKEEVV